MCPLNKRNGLNVENVIKNNNSSSNENNNNSKRNVKLWNNLTTVLNQKLSVLDGDKYLVGAVFFLWNSFWIVKRHAGVRAEYLDPIRVERIERSLQR